MSVDSTNAIGLVTQRCERGERLGYVGPSESIISKTMCSSDKTAELAERLKRIVV